MFIPALPARLAAARISTALLPLFALAPIASAQFDNEWLEFTNADGRIVADAAVGASDTQEKDYAHADFDKDGWTDLVCVRKQPNHTLGRRTNVLFMNETGFLVDRTAIYATASDVANDMGFLTETNDRDVVAVDIDNDTWIDIVTATTLSPSQPKHISHPRVYYNLGDDANGNWLGFRYEDARIPQLMLTNGTPSWPRFTAVDAGDVTGDGFADLYFGDNDNAGGNGGGDMNDRLLVNDGTGNFIDMSSVALTAAMLNVAYTTAVVIVDVNQDGHADIVRDRGHGGGLSVVYNDPNNVGTFANLQTVQTGSPYYANVGDLNQDDLPDIVISDNGPDKVRYNQGPSGAVTQWSSSQNFSYVTGGDDGFGGDSHVADLDNDGWNDVVITDYDIELSGCNRRTHVYHNAGGTPGGSVTLREEAGSAGGPWRGAVGLLANNLTGTHDAALFDLDNDGDLDMVLGRCTGTFVWLNETVPTPMPTLGTPYCATSANSVDPLGAFITASGTTSVASNSLMLAAGPMELGQPGVFYYGAAALAGVPFGNGVRCVGGNVVVRLFPISFANGLGNQTVIINNTLPVHSQITPGATLNFQCWYRDPAAGMSGFNLSNGLSITFEP